MSDPGTRFDDVLECGCTRESGTWFPCAKHLDDPGGQRAANIDREASRVDAAFDRARDEGLI